MGELVKDPWSNGVCYLFFQAPGRLSPERDGWPGPGTPAAGAALMILPYRGVSLMQFFPCSKEGVGGWGF